MGRLQVTETEQGGQQPQYVPEPAQNYGGELTGDETISQELPTENKWETWQIIGLITLLLLIVGGTGFGIYFFCRANKPSAGRAVEPVADESSRRPRSQSSHRDSVIIDIAEPDHGYPDAETVQKKQRRRRSRSRSKSVSSSSKKSKFTLPSRRHTDDVRSADGQSKTVLIDVTDLVRGCPEALPLSSHSRQQKKKPPKPIDSIASYADLSALSKSSTRSRSKTDSFVPISRLNSETLDLKR